MIRAGGVWPIALALLICGVTGCASGPASSRQIQTQAQTTSRESLPLQKALRTNVAKFEWPWRRAKTAPAIPPELAAKTPTGPGSTTAPKAGTAKPSTKAAATPVELSRFYPKVEPTAPAVVPSASRRNFVLTRPPKVESTVAKAAKPGSRPPLQNAALAVPRDRVPTTIASRSSEDVETILPVGLTIPVPPRPIVEERLTSLEVTTPKQEATRVRDAALSEPPPLEEADEAPRSRPATPDHDDEAADRSSAHTPKMTPEARVKRVAPAADPETRRTEAARPEPVPAPRERLLDRLFGERRFSLFRGELRDVSQGR